MSAAIDYVAEAELPGAGARLGVVELIGIDAALFGGESSAAEIGARFDVCRRTVVRRRKALLAMGYRLRVVESEATEAQRLQLAARMRRRNTKGRR